VLAAALPVLAGCSIGPETHSGPAVPATFRAATGEAPAWPRDGWWRGFQSAELDALIAQARAQNFDIAAAIARVQQADAQVRVAGAGLLPSLNATGDASWRRASLGSSGGGRSANATAFETHSYSLGLNVAYEADFWGKIRAGRQAAVAGAIASRFDAGTVALTVETDVALTWFNALAFADRLAVAQRNLADAEQVLAVSRGRLAAGTASALDVAQQEALVASERALIPSLRSQMEQQLIALGILTGQAPEAIAARPGTLTALSLPPVAPGLPSQLLERRPDVAAAEAQLQAADFNVAAARAAFFPNIQLTGSAGFQNAALGTLFGPGGFLASLAAGLTQPLFDGGTLRGQLEQAKGRQAELLADYRKAVVQAFTDVDNALTAWRFASEQEALQARAVETARRALDIARAQMQAGTTDITAVLQAETTLLNDEDTLVQVRLARAQALVNLYKALGGGWVAPPGALQDRFPGLSPGLVPGGLALPVGGNAT
jgi:NodT family efflux transporter outer membrane factor (OMF) lipoprotein